MIKVGYLIVFILHIAFGQSNPGHIWHITMSAGPVQKLADEVRNTPQYKLDGFKTDGFYRINNVGKYLSHNLLNYMRYGSGDPRAEGTIITAYYSDSLPPLATKDKSVSYIINSDQLDSRFRQSMLDYLLRSHRENREG